MPQTDGESSSPARQNLAEQARAVLAAALHGELGPDAAAMHMALLAQAARVEEITELKTEVERLGRLLDGRK